MLPISLGSHDLLRGRTVCGTLFGGLKPKLDIPILVDSYLKKVIKMNLHTKQKVVVLTYFSNQIMYNGGDVILYYYNFLNCRNLIWTVLLHTS